MSLTPAQEMLNVKLNCDGFMTDSESEEEEGVSKLSKKSGALLDVKKKPGVVLAVEEQVVIDLRQKKFNIFPLGGLPIGFPQNACLVNCGLLTALMRFHSDLAQEVN